MKWKLWLDDTRDLPHGYDDEWIIARDPQTVMTHIKVYGYPVEVSLDHDLGLVIDGYDVAEYLVMLDIYKGTMPPDFKYASHSSNPTWHDRIEGLFANYLQQKAERKNQDD